MTVTLPLTRCFRHAHGLAWGGSRQTLAPKKTSGHRPSGLPRFVSAALWTSKTRQRALETACPVHSVSTTVGAFLGDRPKLESSEGSIRATRVGLSPLFPTFCSFCHRLFAHFFPHTLSLTLCQQSGHLFITTSPLPSLPFSLPHLNSPLPHYVPKFVNSFSST